jgi:2-polyprenyl-6-methoxyphenol hydroxylase-like FAD-dependent oxidoreductase
MTAVAHSAENVHRAGHFDVAIVGCGPVGALLAILLGRSNHRVLVLERHNAPYPLPRAVHFDDEIARIFAAAGVPAVAHSEPARTYEWCNAAGHTLLRFDYNHEGQSGWPAANMFSQPELEALLSQEMAKLPTLCIRRGYEVIDVAQNDMAVEIVSRDISNDSVHQYSASYAVGCDGANSFVRQRMDTTVHDLGFAYDWLIVDVVLDEGRVFEPDNLQVCDPRRPTTVVSGGPGRRRWEFMRLESESVDELNNEEFAWRLLEPWNVTKDNARLERHAVYRFQALWAENWRDKRLFVAGDAAHQMPPFAGQGMCSGLRDAANLAWKLDLVFSLGVPDTVLDSYTPERRAHVQNAIAMSRALGEVICATDPTAVAQRDEFMLGAGGDPAQVLPPMPPPSLPDGLLQGATSSSHAPPVGTLSFQTNVASAQRTGRFDEIIGTGFVLASIGDLREVLGSGRLKALDALGARLVRIINADSEIDDVPHDDVTTVVRDIDGRYLAYLTQEGLEAVLIRPDFYIFGVAPTLTQVPALVDDLLEQLHVGVTP